jgi:hypothetical protein
MGSRGTHEDKFKNIDKYLKYFDEVGERTRCEHLLDSYQQELKAAGLFRRWSLNKKIAKCTKELDEIKKRESVSFKRIK